MDDIPEEIWRLASPAQARGGAHVASRGSLRQASWRVTAYLIKVSLFTLVLCSAARAGELFTPSLLVPDVATYRFICIATNVGTKAKSVTVELIGSDSGTVAASRECQDLAPNKSCFVTTGSQIFDGHCHFSGAAKIRGAIWVQKQSDSTIVTALPASK